MEEISLLKVVMIILSLVESKLFLHFGKNAINQDIIGFTMISVLRSD
jgi:hypothetical protein